MADYSLREHVFQRIREDILNGKYQKDEELKEVSLGKELGVSRTPVREALRQLELEGLVNIVPNKGAFVTGISEKDVHDIYVIRSMLEGLCVRWTTDNITKEQIDQLEEILLLASFHLKKGNADQITELDGKFHHVLYEASQSRILEHVLSDFHKYVQMARNQSVKIENRAEKSLSEHTAILNAIKSGDKDKAEALANDHIFHVMKNLHIDQ